MKLKYPIGLISNNNAKRNSKGLIDTSKLVNILGGSDNCLLKETADLQELDKAIEEFSNKKIGIILSSGGDGTHQKLISTIINKYKGYSPLLIPLKAGTMNMLPNNLGLSKSPYVIAKWLDGVIKGKQKYNILIKHLLDIQSPIMKTHKYGFVFLSGCGYNLLEQYYSYPRGGKRSAAKAIIASMSGWLTKNQKAKSIYSYTPSNFIIDNKKVKFPYLITLASSLENLVLGFSPFALRKSNTKKGFYTMIDGEPMWQNYNIFKFFRINDKEEWKKYRIVTKINTLTLDVDKGFSVDGELFKLKAPTTVTISYGPRIRFLSPLGL